MSISLPARPVRDVTLDLSEDEVTGIVQREFYDEDRTPVSGLDVQTLEDVSVVVRAIRCILQRYVGEPRRLVRGMLFSAVGED